jgi:hypothetical protein
MVSTSAGSMVPPKENLKTPSPRKENTMSRFFPFRLFSMETLFLVAFTVAALGSGNVHAQTYGENLPSQEHMA